MADTRRRRLKPVHFVIVALLLIAIGALAYEWAHIVPTVAGRPPPTVPSSNTITSDQAQAEIQGGSRDGANSSQDAYTSQNQSREPAETRRPQ